jgi:hypothetical protein
LHDVDDQTIDAVSQRWAVVEETMTVPLGNVEAVLEGGQYLSPAQQFGLSILSSSLGDRPIHFASRDTAQSFGVEDDVVLQGLAYHLPNGIHPEDLPEGVVEIPPSAPAYALTGPYVNVARTEQLLEEVFLYRSGLPDSGRWPDHSVTANGLYYRSYWALAQAAALAGDREAVERYVERAEMWGALGS